MTCESMLGSDPVPDADGDSLRGQNVCLTSIYGKCRRGAAKCPYSHDKTYVSQSSLQDAETIDNLRAGMEMLHGEYAPEAIESMAPLLVHPTDGALWIPRFRDEHMAEVNRERHAYIARLKRDGCKQQL